MAAITICSDFGAHLTCLLRNLYAGQEATVRAGHVTTDWFQIEKGVRGVGGKAGAEQAAVERGKLAPVERAAARVAPAQLFQAALEALADERGFIGFREAFLERGFDVAVGDATGAKLASDAVATLAAGLGAIAGELARVAGVVEKLL